MIHRTAIYLAKRKFALYRYFLALLCCKVVTSCPTIGSHTCDLKCVFGVSSSTCKLSRLNQGVLRMVRRAHRLHQHHGRLHRPVGAVVEGPRPGRVLRVHGQGISWNSFNFSKFGANIWGVRKCQEDIDYIFPFKRSKITYEVRHDVVR